jgi:ribosome-binding ATPase
MPPEDRADFLADLGLEETGLAAHHPRAYELLGPDHLLHRRPKEARAWTVEKGARAPEAAGEIHTDFERGFIRAETIAYDDYPLAAARRVRRKPARCAPKARIMSSRTATCFCSASTFERCGVQPPGHDW